jgi:hypothetical protein
VPLAVQVLLIAAFVPGLMVLAVRFFLPVHNDTAKDPSGGSGALAAWRLSYRDVEELLAERGREVDHVTVQRWVYRFTPILPATGVSD